MDAIVTTRSLREVFDLTDPARNVIFDMTLDEARARVAEGDPARIGAIEGHFALVGRRGSAVRLARTLGRPMRYFIAKEEGGPVLVVAERIDEIGRWLSARGLAGQFHPSYTRMVPAHHVTEIALVGCPDPSPRYERFFTPAAAQWPADEAEIGRRYAEAIERAIARWLLGLAPAAPVGVAFSGGVDSGAIFLLAYHAMLQLGMNPARLKAFTLAIDGRGEDLDQARRFLDALGLGLFHEPVEASAAELDYRRAVAVIEDYKPLDVQSAAMTLALCRGIRRRHPQWTHLLDGDGGDENLKDYPIEENPELTIRSVLGNRLLYQEGWGIDAIKHSLTYTGGLSRAGTRGSAAARAAGMLAFSPMMLPSVIEVAERIPFVELTEWDPQQLYELKGRVVAAGVERVTGMRMPIFPKRRFQHGAVERSVFRDRFPRDEAPYRRAFAATYDG
jgi:asparagine synthase (glutamine-hydrolysing)